MKHLDRVALVILIGAALSGIAFGSYNLLVHGWATHYGLLIAMGGLLCGTLLLTASVRVNVMMVTLSLVIPIYMAELILARGVASHLQFNANDWLNFPSDFNAKEALERLQAGKSASPAYDTRTRLEVIADLRDQHIPAYPLIFPEVMVTAAGLSTIKSLFSTDDQELLPLAGLSKTPTVFCNESGQYIVYDSDEHGFHNPPAVWNPPVDIVAVGDSFTHGACVPSDRGFVALIRERHDSTVNLGMTGDGPLTTLATLKEYGSALRPRNVLWVYFEGNDGRDLAHREKHSPLLMSYLHPDFHQDLLHRQGDIDRVLRAYLDQAMRDNQAQYGFEPFLKLHYVRKSLNELSQKKAAVDGVPGATVDALRALGAPLTADDFDLFETILTQASRLVRSWGGRVYFVYLPTWERYRLPEIASQDRERVLHLVKKLGLPLIDLHPVFARHPDPLSLFPGRRYAHYNIAGHQLVAEEVLRHLPSAGEMKSSVNSHATLPSLEHQTVVPSTRVETARN